MMDDVEAVATWLSFEAEREEAHSESPTLTHVARLNAHWRAADYRVKAAKLRSGAWRDDLRTYLQENPDNAG